jgi:hypothetical protein
MSINVGRSRDSEQIVSERAELKLPSQRCGCRVWSLVFGRRFGLASDGPSFECNHDDSPRHEERCESHDDREDEHRHDAATLHGSNYISATGHEDQPTTDQTKRREQFCGRTTRIYRGWRRDVEEEVSEDACNRKTREECAPLAVNLG